MRQKILFILIPLTAFFITGCTNVFFQPSGKLHYDPVNLSQKYDVVRFKSYDGTELTGMFFPAKEKAKGTIIHFHGNAGNMTSHFYYSSWFIEHGLNVFIFDYRGYGASKGKPDLDKVIEDCKYAINSIINEKKLNRKKIIIFGQSLGGALAIASLSQLSDFQPALLILEGTFSSYKSVASKALRQSFFTFPFSWLPYLIISDKYKPSKLISKIKCPIIFLHSAKDKKVPFNEDRKLYKHVLSEKEIWTIPDGHIEAFGKFRSKYKKKILEKINKSLGY